MIVFLLIVATALAASEAVSAQQAASLDSCLLGTWTETDSSYRQSNPDLVLSGGGGEVMVFRGDGTFSQDDNNVRSLTGTDSNGGQLQLTVAGRATGHFITSISTSHLDIR